MNVTLFRDLPTEQWWSMERYADELTRALQSIGCAARGYVAARPFPRLRGAANTLANYAWRTTIYPLAVCARQGDVNHIVDHSYAHLIDTLDPRRTIVTCHDLAPRALNEGRGLGRWLWERSFRAMRRAAGLIADSEFTRAEILRYSNYPAERIAVVPLAVGAEFFEPVLETDVRALRERYRLSGRRVILHVGSCAPRKNIELILSAMSQLDATFVQVGGAFTKDQRALLSNLDLQARVIQAPAAFGYALRVWYHSADIFVFPSTYEGFGMPLLEAMAAGVPSVCAHTSSLPEVAGDAAIWVEPYDAAQLAQAITRVLNDAPTANALRERGRARARQFTWERTARATLAVYQQVADERFAR